MKIKQLIKHLTAIAEEYPNLEVIYSCDDEGNSFAPVQYKPTVGHYSDDGEFEVDTEEKMNCVCIN